MTGGKKSFHSFHYTPLNWNDWNDWNDWNEWNAFCMQRCDLRIEVNQP
jgi:hypothetical protein